LSENIAGNTHHFSSIITVSSAASRINETTRLTVVTQQLIRTSHENSSIVA